MLFLVDNFPFPRVFYAYKIHTKREMFRVIAAAIVKRANNGYLPFQRDASVVIRRDGEISWPGTFAPRIIRYDDPYLGLHG